MLLLITGGSASGKSAYGEERVLQLGPDKSRFYIATMRPFGRETKEKIRLHQEMREGKQFQTLECFTSLESLKIPPIGLWENRVILLECLSNLTANEQYENQGTKEAIQTRIQKGIQGLQKQAGSIIIVTNEVFSTGEVYDPETMEYLQILGGINQALAKMADQVVEVVYGIPVILKNTKEKGKNNGEMDET